MSRGFDYADDEIKTVRDNPWMSANALAEKLGRTPKSVKNLRYRIKHPVFEVSRRRPEAEFDERPSGWYEETVGLLLIQDDDSFETWKHYHRYVEIEYTGEVKDRITSWVTLRCRRDADVP